MHSCPARASHRGLPEGGRPTRSSQGRAGSAHESARTGGPQEAVPHWHPLLVSSRKSLENPGSAQNHMARGSFRLQVTEPDSLQERREFAGRLDWTL